ncbi:glycosyltransferase family 4 protein [Klebsiella spallanzanii]|uniref:glycosyltransferase family 4 protein n=1 Tax=Klebsiella spallanzanii TaxID=2587528 RepID=UPI0025979C35|nr:glycosyltransferase family 4 protein [Klebsiella spallanzanii]MDM4207493.1 glycosyltransferase family 4 protein [Klebsiella spallanzanii]
MLENSISVGIVADWLVTYAGAERVVKEMIELFPDSDVYSIVDFLSDEARANFNDKKSTTTFIQHLPKAKQKYQTYLPLMPLAIEQIDVSKHDVILSSSHAVAKGILTGPDQLHISYVHSPIRYAWDLQHQYLKEAKIDKGLKGILAKYLLHKIRMWDVRTSNGVDHFIANSKFISRRIKKVYGRDADVIYPPVEVERFDFNENKDDFYLTASRMVPYKRMDLIVEAFANMPDKKLVVIGDGSEMPKIKKKAASNIEILGYQPDQVLHDYMRRAKAFIFAAEEDFGITPVEAQACGTPVIAYGKGGVLETVRPYGINNPTGLFFDRQTISSLVDAVKKFDNIQNLILPSDCKENSQSFSSDRFKRELNAYIEHKWKCFSDKKKIEY